MNTIKSFIYQHRLYHLHQLLNLSSIQLVGVIKNVISVPTLLHQPLQRPTFALNAPLDVGVTQPVAVAEKDHGSAPRATSNTSRLQLLLQGLLVGVSERAAHVDNQEEGACWHQEVRGHSEEAWRVQHRHCLASDFGSLLRAAGGQCVCAEGLSPQDGVSTRALSCFLSTNQH